MATRFATLDDAADYPEWLLVHRRRRFADRDRAHDAVIQLMTIEQIGRSLPLMEAARDFCSAKIARLSADHSARQADCIDNHRMPVGVLNAARYARQGSRTPPDVCVRCGYALVMLTDDDACPECALAVARSRAYRLDGGADRMLRRWLRIEWAWRLVCVAAIFGLLASGVVILQFLMPFLMLFGPWAIYAPWLVLKLAADAGLILLAIAAVTLATMGIRFRQATDRPLLPAWYLVAVLLGPGGGWLIAWLVLTDTTVVQVHSSGVVWTSLCMLAVAALRYPWQYERIAHFRDLAISPRACYASARFGWRMMILEWAILGLIAAAFGGVINVAWDSPAMNVILGLALLLALLWTAYSLVIVRDALGRGLAARFSDDHLRRRGLLDPDRFTRCRPSSAE